MKAYWNLQGATADAVCQRMVSDRRYRPIDQASYFYVVAHKKI